MSKSFGKTWWGQQWLNALKNIDYGNRLARGSSYANKGAVKKIEVTQNRINAKVQGSRPKPYSIDIVLPLFSENQRRDFISKLAEKPTIISKLINRELDPEVLAIAERLGLKVFPKQWSDLQMKCSCPDWAVPCKHLAAVIYKMSVEIDNNPFLVFSLHNMDLIEEMNKLGNFVTKESFEIPAFEDLFAEEKPKQKLKNHYNTENAYQKLAYSSLQPIFEPLTTLLADNPAFYVGKANFKELYKNRLERVVKTQQNYCLINRS